MSIPFRGQASVPYRTTYGEPTTLLNQGGTFPIGSRHANSFGDWALFNKGWFPSTAQFSAPFDTSIYPTSNFSALWQNPAGIYGFLVATNLITNLKITLTRADFTFAEIFDLATGLDPSALPAGILTAVPVDLNWTYVDPIDSPPLPDPSWNIPASGWRFTLDSRVILGGDDPFTIVINVDSSEYPNVPSANQDQHLSLIQSPWGYSPA